MEVDDGNRADGGGRNERDDDAIRLEFQILARFTMAASSDSPRLRFLSSLRYDMMAPPAMGSSLDGITYATAGGGTGGGVRDCGGIGVAHGIERTAAAALIGARPKSLAKATARQDVRPGENTTHLRQHTVLHRGSVRTCAVGNSADAGGTDVSACISMPAALTVCQAKMSTRFAASMRAAKMAVDARLRRDAAVAAERPARARRRQGEGSRKRHHSPGGVFPHLR